MKFGDKFLAWIGESICACRLQIFRASFALGVKAIVQLESSIPIDAKVEISPKGFTLGVKANVQLKSSIPIDAKVEINHKGFALGVKGKTFQSAPSY